MLMLLRLSAVPECSQLLGKPPTVADRCSALQAASVNCPVERRSPSRRKESQGVASCKANLWSELGFSILPIPY